MTSNVVYWKNKCLVDSVYWKNMLISKGFEQHQEPNLSFHQFAEAKSFASSGPYGEP